MERSIQSSKQEIQVLKTNQQAELSNKDIQIQLSQAELSKYYPTIISLANQLKIKSNRIQTIIQTKYIYKDSITSKDSIRYIYKRDTLNKDVKFMALKDCYTIYGEGKDSTTRITRVEFKDNLTTYIYKDYEHKFLFFHWGEFIRVKEYSECQHDTIHITGNIRVK
jgi:hypothetical protein